MQHCAFTKKKFLSLDKRQQHKHCAHLLKTMYDYLCGQTQASLRNTTYDTAVDFYRIYLSWMHLSWDLPKDTQKISDRYHWHLKEGKISLKEHNLLPRIRTQDRTAQKPFGSCAIYLDRLRSAYNVGSILRTTEALRIGPVYFHPDTPFINQEKVQKVSMGTYDLVPCVCIESLEILPRPWIALETSDEHIEISGFLFPKTCTLFVGNEEYGLCHEVLQKIDFLVTIPLFGSKNSINVACAFAIAAQEIRRQH
jgi:tRNA(Leu) C34 or U34 (ribose-2'-O)-methylase TrmL